MVLSNIEKSYIGSILLRYEVYLISNRDRKTVTLQRVLEFLKEDEALIAGDLNSMNSELVEEMYKDNG